MKVKCIKNVYKFKQGDYLKSYILKMAGKRAQQTDPESKALYKLIMNSLYGTTIKDKFRYAKRHVVVEGEEKLIVQTTKDTFESIEELKDNRFIITHNKKRVVCDSPLFIGFSILDFSKDIVYKFFHNELKAHYGDNVELLYMDTDSYIIELKCPSLDDELRGFLNPYIDFSNFPTNHPLYSSSRKGELGLLKIETGEKKIKEFVCLRPKVYSLHVKGDEDIKPLKGLSYAAQKDISHIDYLTCLTNQVTTTKDMYNLRNVGGVMSLIKSNKVALRLLDDKRYWLDATKSLAYGHPRLSEEGR